MVHKAAHQGSLQLMPVVLAPVVQPARPSSRMRPLVPPPPHGPLSARGALPLSARHFPPVSPPPVMLPPLPAPPRCSLLTGPCAAVVWAVRWDLGRLRPCSSARSSGQLVPRSSDLARASARSPVAWAVRADLGRLRPPRPAAAGSACPPPAPRRARSTSRARSRCCASTGGHARHSTRACDRGPRLRTWAPRHAVARSGRYECTR